jgi:hypothetical protein
MSDDMLCPDCGGIIGAKVTTDAGRPCTCFGPVDEAAAVGTATAPASGEKVCWKCGKDVSNSKRAKDSNGYWCYECHKQDRIVTKPQGARCADCGRQVKESALFDYGGLQICTLCKSARDEVTKREKKYRAGVDSATFKQADRRTLVVMLCIVAILGGIIVLHQWLHVI